MSHHAFRHAVRDVVRFSAIAAAVAVAAVSQASAGSCCHYCAVPCVAPGRYIPVLDVPDAAALQPYLIVNHGPVFTGPGSLWAYPRDFDIYHPMPVYPYVAVDYYYPRVYGVSRFYGRRALRVRY